MKSRICIDIESLRLSPSRPEYGLINLSIGENNFPDKNWTDFAIVILAAWARSLFKIKKGISTLEVIHFMDGPYFVEISSVGFDKIFMEAFRDCKKKEIFSSNEVSLNEFSKSVISLGYEAIGFFRKKDWWSRDASELNDAILSLEKTI